MQESNYPGPGKGGLERRPTTPAAGLYICSDTTTLWPPGPMIDQWQHCPCPYLAVNMANPQVLTHASRPCPAAWWPRLCLDVSWHNLESSRGRRAYNCAAVSIFMVAHSSKFAGLCSSRASLLETPLLTCSRFPSNDRGASTSPLCDPVKIVKTWICQHRLSQRQKNM